MKKVAQKVSKVKAAKDKKIAKELQAKRVAIKKA